jgi:hypothetical protein
VTNNVKTLHECKLFLMCQESIGTKVMFFSYAITICLCSVFLQIFLFSLHGFLLDCSCTVYEFVVIIAFPS